MQRRLKAIMSTLKESTKSHVAVITLFQDDSANDRRLFRIVIPGPLSEAEVGEQFAKFPLENDHIKPNFNDDLSDIPFYQREQIRMLYSYDLQPRLIVYQPYLDKLRENVNHRIEKNQNYQNFLKEIKKKEVLEDEESEEFGQNDLQLVEANNVMKDLIFLMQ